MHDQLLTARARTAAAGCSSSAGTKHPGVDEVGDDLDVLADAEDLDRLVLAGSVDTAVTASLCSIRKRVMGKNDGSWPTRVMSVPCRVVTTFSRSGPTICRAR